MSCAVSRSAGVPVLLIVHRARLDPWRHGDGGDPVPNSRTWSRTNRQMQADQAAGPGPGAALVVGSQPGFVPPDQQGHLPHVGA